MKNKLLFMLGIVLLVSFKIKAQEVKLITLSQLENRLLNRTDTTFVVNFWATWCKPCVRELPEFEKFKEATKAKPIKTILVSIDMKSKLETGVEPFVKSHHLSGEIYLLTDAPSIYIERLNPDWSGAIPATLIIHAKSGKKSFHESSYTYDELMNEVTEK